MKKELKIPLIIIGTVFIILCLLLGFFLVLKQMEEEEQGISFEEKTHTIAFEEEIIEDWESFDDEPITLVQGGVDGTIKETWRIVTDDQQREVSRELDKEEIIVPMQKKIVKQGMLSRTATQKNVRDVAETAMETWLNEEFATLYPLLSLEEQQRYTEEELETIFAESGFQIESYAFTGSTNFELKDRPQTNTTSQGVNKQNTETTAKKTTTATTTQATTTTPNPTTTTTTTPSSEIQGNAIEEETNTPPTATVSSTVTTTTSPGTPSSTTEATPQDEAVQKILAELEEKRLVAILPLEIKFFTEYTGGQKLETELYVVHEEKESWKLLYPGPTNYLSLNLEQNQDDGAATMGYSLSYNITLKHALLLDHSETMFFGFDLANTTKPGDKLDEALERKAAEIVALTPTPTPIIVNREPVYPTPAPFDLFALLELTNIFVTDDPETPYELVDSNLISKENWSTVAPGHDAIAWGKIVPAPADDIDTIILSAECSIAGIYKAKNTFGAIEIR